MLCDHSHVPLHHQNNKKKKKKRTIKLRKIDKKEKF